MRCFSNIEIDNKKSNTLIFHDVNGKLYLFDLTNLAEEDDEFAKVAYRYREPFVLKRSVYQTLEPDGLVSIIKWLNDSCDIPVGAFFFDYEDYIVPFLKEVGRDEIAKVD